MRPVWHVDDVEETVILGLTAQFSSCIQRQQEDFDVIWTHSTSTASTNDCPQTDCTVQQIYRLISHTSIYWPHKFLLLAYSFPLIFQLCLFKSHPPPLLCTNANSRVPSRLHCLEHSARRRAVCTFCLSFRRQLKTFLFQQSFPVISFHLQSFKFLYTTSSWTLQQFRLALDWHWHWHPYGVD